MAAIRTGLVTSKCSVHHRPRGGGGVYIANFRFIKRSKRHDQRAASSTCDSVTRNQNGFRVDPPGSWCPPEALRVQPFSENEISDREGGESTRKGLDQESA